MAVKAGDQISIVDVTDAYAVLLTSESITFVATSSSSLGTQQQATTTVVAYRGDTALIPSVGNITVTNLAGTAITDVTVSKGTASVSGCTLTVTAKSTLTQSAIVNIPVTVDDVTITKKFTVAVAFKGLP